MEDGEAGQVEDIYFDDRSWTVRYVVVNLGRWLPGPRVFLTPRAVARIDVARERLQTTLTEAQLVGSPAGQHVRPVSRQEHAAFARDDGFPYAWHERLGWGSGLLPLLRIPIPVTEPALAHSGSHPGDDPHLRSIADVSGHAIRATDGDLGRLDDFVLHQSSWTIRYAIVDPHRWRPGRRVVLPTDWIMSIEWSERVVSVDVPSATVRAAPAYRRGMPFDRGLQVDLERRVAGLEHVNLVDRAQACPDTDEHRRGDDTAQYRCDGSHADRDAADDARRSVGDEHGVPAAEHASIRGADNARSVSVR